jgi:hypothetical protein
MFFDKPSTDAAGASDLLDLKRLGCRSEKPGK